IEAEDEDENTYSAWFTITIADVNEAPTANDDTASVVEANTVIVTVLANDEDPDDDNLVVSTVSTPSKGAANIQPDNRILYMPDQGACGIDTFTYTIEDGNGESDSASVTVTIQNVAPTARDDTVETQEDKPILIDVLANDSDPGSGSLIVISVGNPSYGTTLIVGNSVRYTPQPRYEGSDRFSYVMQDDCGASANGWVDVRVLHTNHPPNAHAGSFYQGVVGETLTLNASFSNDPDLGDALQYRWDLDGDGTADTEWSREPRYTAIYTRPYAGLITVDVRDLYQGQPTGDSSQATALVRIADVQSIQVFVYEDLNGDGVMDQGELGLPGVDLIIAGTETVTEADGGISADLDTGSWSIAISANAISQLTNRGFAIPETEKTVNLGTGAVETVLFGVSKTSTKMKGFVYADLNENEVYDEDIDQLLQGLRVILDEQRETLTDDAGRFFFLSVPFGEHMLWIGENVKPAEPLSEDANLSLSIPITLERSLRAEFSLLWPWPPVGSDQGFLNVEVEKSGN
ncbi:tandem-95 repeat protein, partial [Candidatus Bipolaricaulota bacterium]|nr:tandem-95 repeat protein [Candidatus Bipolaricaulota bacterium]